MTLCLLNSSLSLPISLSSLPSLFLFLFCFCLLISIYSLFFSTLCAGSLLEHWFFMILEITFINFLHVWLSRKMRLAPITNLITSQKKNFDSFLNDYVWYTSNYMLTQVWMLLNCNLLFSVSWLMVCVCVCVCLVSQSCLTLCDPMDCSLPGSLIHGIFQARVLERVPFSFSRGSREWSTQEMNPGLLHCRQILNHLNHQESLKSTELKYIPLFYFFI